MSRQQESDILKGKTIICTYPKKEPDNFLKIIGSKGAVVHYLPMIEVVPLAFQTSQPLENYDWLIFTSKNGVDSFFSQVTSSSLNNIAALGESTANEIAAKGYKATFFGSGKSAGDFVNEIETVLSPGDKLLLILGTLAPDTLGNAFSDKCNVERINVYQTKKPEKVDSELVQLIEEERYDAIIITSPSAINNLYSSLSNNTQLRVISIGKTTTAAARSLKIEPLATSNDASYEGLAYTTIEYLKKL